MKIRILSIVSILAICMSLMMGSFIFADATTCSYNGISIPDSYTIGVGESRTITVTSPRHTYVKMAASDSSNGIINGISIGTENPTTFKTVNGKVSITIKGKKTGAAYIYATDSFKKGYFATCKITVKKAPASVSLNKSSITLGIGETYDLNSYLPSGTASYSIKYSSNNSKVASVVSAGGLVTAKSVGTATITAKTFNGKTATCKVTVKKAPSSISLNKTSLTLKVGQTYDLNSSVPSGTAAYHIAYSSNNSRVASVVSAGGLVTAKSKGTAVITAKTYNGKTATCRVTVK